MPLYFTCEVCGAEVKRQPRMVDRNKTGLYFCCVEHYREYRSKAPKKNGHIQKRRYTRPDEVVPDA